LTEASQFLIKMIFSIDGNPLHRSKSKQQARILIHLRDLSDDFYSFDEDTMTVMGSTTGNEYRLGDEVRIRVKEVSVEKRQIDLVMLG
jgi:exoribonuclease R